MESTSILISQEISAVVPDLRAHAFFFENARIGIGHRNLDVLRTRVATRVRAGTAAGGSGSESPAVLAFHPLVRAAGLDPAIHPPLHERNLRRVARREPLDVRNDAADAAHLLALYYSRPVFLLEAGFDPPVTFRPSVDEEDDATPPAPVPALCDRQRVLATLFRPPSRAEVTEATTDFLLVLLDAGGEPPVDARLLAHRVENWMATVTSARLVRASESGGAG